MSIGDEPRKPIKGAEWIVTVRLQIDGKPSNAEPITLRYVDTYLADLPKKSLGQPEDAGHLIASAIDQRARQWQNKKR